MKRSSDCFTEAGLCSTSTRAQESYDAWFSFVQDLRARGLPAPLLLVISDRRRAWPQESRQTGVAARLTADLLAPGGAQEDAKPSWRSCPGFCRRA